MSKTLEELAAEILNELEKEDFKYAIKHYGCFKLKTTVEKISKFAKKIDEVE